MSSQFVFDYKHIFNKALMTKAIKGNKMKKENKFETQKRFSGNTLQCATLPRMKDILSLVHIELESSWCAKNSS